MFGVDFGEMLVIFVVALVVLGPARLPGLVSKIGRWVGKARTMARQFREQLENEINLEELNRMTEAQTEGREEPAAATRIQWRSAFLRSRQHLRRHRRDPRAVHRSATKTPTRMRTRPMRRPCRMCSLPDPDAPGRLHTRDLST